jgi:DNA-binding winged helix-turn-helix (wHTH) protein
VATNGRFTIGPWTFSPADNELRQGGETRRLEDRAARTLELLCAHRGETVAAETIVERVWNGRQLSPNSLAVVISQLRAALGDNARTPRYIETVAKRGYRLQAPGEEAAPRARRWRAAALIALLLLLAAALFAWSRRSAAEPVILYAPVANETGAVGYDPLTTSVNELLLTELKRTGLRVVQQGSAPGGRRVALSAKLILWTGNPTVTLSATDVATGEVVWSEMAQSPPSSFPRGMREDAEALAALLKTP